MVPGTFCACVFDFPPKKRIFDRRFLSSGVIEMGTGLCAQERRDVNPTGVPPRIRSRAVAGCESATAFFFVRDVSLTEPNVCLRPPVFSIGFVLLVVVALPTARVCGQEAPGSIVAWGSEVRGVDLSGGFVAVAGGGDHSLGLESDGSIVGWGDNYYGQLDVPDPNTGFVAVAAGGYHSLGLKVDGSIVGWGWNNSGQANLPASNSSFVGVAAGGSHSLGLKADGSLVAWGNNADGQANVPASNSGFIAVSAGRNHSLGLKGVFGDANVDGRVDLEDMALFGGCINGPGALPPLDCTLTRMDSDWDVDLRDFADFQNRFGSP